MSLIIAREKAIISTQAYFAPRIKLELRGKIFLVIIMKDDIKRIKRMAADFAIGGAGYAAIELLWRRRTHWTMALAGGICSVIFSEIAQKCKSKPLIYKAALCGASVTGIELIFGMVFNIILKMDVWDYSERRFNFLGQICPAYSLLWFLLAAAALPALELINSVLEG